MRNRVLVVVQEVFVQPRGVSGGQESVYLLVNDLHHYTVMVRQLFLSVLQEPNEARVELWMVGFNPESSFECLKGKLRGCLLDKDWHECKTTLMFVGDKTKLTKPQTYEENYFLHTK